LSIDLIGKIINRDEIAIDMYGIIIVVEGILKRMLKSFYKTKLSI
jgi:hypothetical protein